MDREAWQATVHGVARVGLDLATKPPPPDTANLEITTRLMASTTTIYHEYSLSSRYTMTSIAM